MAEGAVQRGAHPAEACQRTDGSRTAMSRSPSVKQNAVGWQTVHVSSGVAVAVRTRSAGKTDDVITEATLRYRDSAFVIDGEAVLLRVDGVLQLPWVAQPQTRSRG